MSDTPMPSKSHYLQTPHPYEPVGEARAKFMGTFADDRNLCWFCGGAQWYSMHTLTLQDKRNMAAWLRSIAGQVGEVELNLATDDGVGTYALSALLEMAADAIEPEPVADVQRR